jgi:hypothetical protein
LLSALALRWHYLLLARAFSGASFAQAGIGFVCIHAHCWLRSDVHMGTAVGSNVNIQSDPNLTSNVSGVRISRAPPALMHLSSPASRPHRLYMTQKITGEKHLIDQMTAFSCACHSIVVVLIQALVLHGP